MLTLTANKSGAKVDERAARQCDADSFLTRTVASVLAAVHWVLASSQSSEHTDLWYLQHETAAKLSMIKKSTILQRIVYIQSIFGKSNPL